ncbi:mechanosensitive ion channel family protein [Pedobacter sp. Leaf176]|uniref:mechanosensitive ion channel family protein n=1 Tax=Pedobacter sp. Leaf176 TaxID=1736286 RepID=UPI0006FAC7F8|nr:mechanosensitive ion channel family protein [Pedobacter sp. Leaf176]KQR66957.1 mechanosensitive ion channel protein MscS [Pedobacter sp. Leaf176]
MSFLVKPIHFYLTLFLFFGVATASSAQLVPGLSDTSTKVAVEIPDDSLGRRTPRGTVNGFIKAVAEQNYIRASHFLNLDKPRRKVAERQRIVKVLQRLLDQGGNIMPYSWLSNKPVGRQDDELPPEEDLVGTVTANGQVINLFVESTGDETAPVWRISSETVKAIAAVSIEEKLLVDRILPSTLKDNLWGGVPAGHWLAIILLFILAYVAARLVVWLMGYLLRVSWTKARTEKGVHLIDEFSLPIRLYLAVWLFIAISQQVGISIIVRQRFSTVTLIVGLVALIFLLLRLTDVVSNFSRGRMSDRGRVSAVSIILFLKRAIKIAIVIFGVIGILSTFGFDVTTGLAALGIGGIALALGAQKTVENFVGSVTLITDQPVRVGDFCKVGDISGTVEQIGMRSTQLRTGERTIVTIPNGDFSSNRIENFAHRDRFLFNPILQLRYETTPDQIRYLLVELRKVLYAHPLVNPDPARIRFAGYSTHSLNLEVWSYINTPNFDEFLEVKEDLLLRFMDVVAASGTAFAFPSQTLYFGKDAGVSPEKATEVSEKIKAWKANNNMQLPNFEAEEIEKLRGTIPYPPEGTVGHKHEDN